MASLPYSSPGNIRKDPGLLVGAYHYALRVEAYLGFLIDRYSRFSFAA